MKVTVEFRMDNAAFADDPGNLKVQYVFMQACRKLVERMSRVPATRRSEEDTLLDTNGNTIGFVKLEEKAP